MKGALPSSVIPQDGGPSSPTQGPPGGQEPDSEDEGVEPRGDNEVLNQSDDEDEENVSDGNTEISVSTPLYR